MVFFGNTAYTIMFCASKFAKSNVEINLLTDNDLAKNHCLVKQVFYKVL